MSLPITSTFLCVPDAHELRAHRQRVREIPSTPPKDRIPTLSSRQLVLNQARRGGEKHVRRHRGDHDHLDFFRANAFRRQQFLRRFRSQMRRGHARVGVVPLADAGARANPLVGGIHTFSRSKFVTTRGGTYPATPVIFAAMRLPIAVTHYVSQNCRAIVCNPLAA